MKYSYIGKSNIYASRLALGLMRISNKTHEEAVEIIKTALDVGINFFDHADIYGAGKSEIVFSKAIKALNIDRSKYYLQSKIGIRPNVSYDFSKEYIIKSVDEILERLDTPYLDSLLLHRPDILWEPEEINLAFNELKKTGKVLNFGVSNMHQDQLSFLKSRLDVDIITNQLQLSIMHQDLFSSGVYVNANLTNQGFNAIGILDYMREHHITMQAWSPFQYGMFEGVFLDNEKFETLNLKLEEIALKYQTTKLAISIAWINKHPAKIQTIIGTMTPSRIIESSKGIDIELTKEEWYQIYVASGNKLI